MVLQLLVESGVLGLLGGMAGIVLAFAAVSLVRAHMPDTIPRVQEIDVDARVLAVSITVSVVLAAVFGVLPALVTTRVNLSNVMRASSRNVSSRGSARVALVVGQIALAVVLLAGSSLLLRSFLRLNGVDSGFEPDHLLTFHLSISYPNDPRSGKYLAEATRVPYFTQVLRRLNEVPGVEGAAFMSAVPFSAVEFPSGALSGEGLSVQDLADLPRAELQAVSAELFKVMRIPVISGRVFDATEDLATNRPVAILGQALARRLWPGENAVGKRIKLGPPNSPAPWQTVVGVVGDIRTHTLEGSAVPQVYVPYTTFAPLTIGVLMRTAMDPLALRDAMPKAIQSVEQQQPIYDIRSMEERMGLSLGQRESAAYAAGTFALLAMILATVGLYGLVAFMVVQRKSELGVRMALGAAPSAIVRLVLAQGTRIAASGVAVGLVAASLIAHGMDTMVFGIGVYDPISFILAPTVLLLTALLATWIVATRAVREDPIRALRLD
jgi:predicted permease